VFRRFAADPNAKSMFGILNNDKISSGVATLVRDGIGLPGDHNKVTGFGISQSLQEQGQPKGKAAEHGVPYP
jgi:hypothetical protein